VRGSLQRGIRPVPVAFEFLIHHLHPEAEPPGIDLGVHEPQAGVAFEDASESQLGKRGHTGPAQVVNSSGANGNFAEPTVHAWHQRGWLPC
jgi:hypothetical protein